MVSLKIYLVSYFLALTRSIHGYYFAGNLRGGLKTGVTRGEMRSGLFVNGLAGGGISRNIPGAEGFLVGQNGFGQAVNSGAINLRPLGNTARGASGLGGNALGVARGIMGPLNGGPRSRANGAIGGVVDVDGVANGGASGRGADFNGGTSINEQIRHRAPVGVQGLNGGGFGDVLKVFVLNGGFEGVNGGSTGGRSSGNGDFQNGARSFEGRQQNIDQNGNFGNFRPRLVGGVGDFNDGVLGSSGIGSNGVFEDIVRGANMLNGPTSSSLVNQDQANNVDVSGQLGNLGRFNGGVDSLQSSGLKQGHMNGGFDGRRTGWTFAGELGNSGVPVDLGGGSSGGVVNSRALFGEFGRLASEPTDRSRGNDRGEIGGVSGQGQGFDDAALLSRLGAVAGVWELNDRGPRDGGAVGGIRESGNVLKVVFVNSGFGGLDFNAAGGSANGMGDSSRVTGTLRQRPNVEFGNLASEVGDRVRGARSDGGGLDTKSSGRSLTNLMRIVSNVVTGLGSVTGDSLGDLSSNGRSGASSSSFIGGNGFDNTAVDGFGNSRSPRPRASSFIREASGDNGFLGGVDARLGRGFKEGRRY